MTVDQLGALHPRLYHMAEVGTWKSIQQNGLLSTSALLDLFQVSGFARHAIESCRRPECVPITHPAHGKAVIRDQKPMSDGPLESCLKGMKPREWYETLNRKVFFWVSEERLLRLLQARAYRSRTHCVLTVGTARLVNRHHRRITLSPINSGSTIFSPQPRGQDTFRAIPDYPFEHWTKKRRDPRRAVVELAVDYSVKDIADFVLLVQHIRGDKVIETLYETDDS